MERTRVDTKAFQEVMRKNGYTLESLSEKISLSKTALFNKIHNKSEFRVSEMGIIGVLFKLNKTEKERIFFATFVE